MSVTPTPIPPLVLSRKRIEQFLILGAVFLTVMGIAVDISYYLLDHKRLLGMVRQFTLAEEANVPTWYSALLLISCAVCLAIIALRLPKGEPNYRRHWIGLAFIFTYMSMDEISVIHEMTIRPLRYAFDLDGFLYYSWVIPAAVLMAIFLIVYLGFLRHLPASSRNRFIVAGLVFVGGAFGTELFIGYWWTTVGDGFASGMLNVTQESMEICGSSLFLSALVRHLEASGGDISFSLRA